MLDRCLTLDSQVALRPEPFGALAYHYGNRKLIFLKNPDVVRVVQYLDDNESDACTIAEALIATAMGLFAAIPAVIAYNRYADKVVRLEIRYDGFTEEFSSILQRHARAKSKVA